jgi:hypothetical protein
MSQTQSLSSASSSEREDHIPYFKCVPPSLRDPSSVSTASSSETISQEVEARSEVPSSGINASTLPLWFR